MVNAAETDIVSPSVAAEDPLGFLCQIIFLGKDCFRSVASARLESRHQLIGGRSVSYAACEGIQPLFCGSFHIFIVAVGNHILDLLFQAVADGFLSQQHTVTELCVILKQGIGPCRALSFGVYGVRCGRCGVTPDGGTARRIGNIHMIAEKLGNQFRVGRLTTACAGA